MISVIARFSKHMKHFTINTNCLRKWDKELMELSTNAEPGKEINSLLSKRVAVILKICRELSFRIAEQRNLSTTAS